MISALNVKIGGGGTAPIGATLTKTGQTVSYRTGDDGDLEAGRATSFTILGSKNPFNTFDRFTDELGGFTYANNIVIDWSTYNGSTVLGYYRIATVAASWNAAIDAALALSIGTFTSGWRMPNKLEMESICNYGTAFILNYSPFNLNATIWISTTYLATTTLAYTMAQSWYQDDWNDQDIIDWVNNVELPKYEVK